MADAYRSRFESLAEQLQLLDLLLRAEVLRFRARVREQLPNPLQALFISDGEIDAALGGSADADEIDALAEQADRLAAAIDERSAASECDLPLPVMARSFGLTRFEQQVLLMAAAPGLDLKYERIYAYLQDDISRRYLSGDLALRVLCPARAARIEARSHLLPQSRLFRAGLLGTGADAGASFLSRPLTVDDAMAGFLLGRVAADPDLAAVMRRQDPQRPLESLRWPASPTGQLIDLVERCVAGPEERLLCVLWGPEGTGRKTLAAAVCRKAGVPLIVADLRELVGRAGDFEDLLRKVFRQSILSQAVLLVDQFDVLLGDDPRDQARRRAFGRCLDELSWATFIAASRPWPAGAARPRHLYVELELPMPDVADREGVWRAAADGVAVDADLGDAAATFRLTPSAIEAALHAAVCRARLRGSDRVSDDDLRRGCYSQSNQRLAELGRRLPGRATWDDLILPANAATQLRELCAQVRCRRRVYHDWGFERRVSSGKGLCALFYGPSGAGKTTAVEIVGVELALEVYKIDLSTVVSKYIGETEKNLSRIFAEAETSNAILFFDEADALFGKRSEVKDAHDRYANIETNYLLQRIEEFDGLVILASNLRKNIDDGFFRRMHVAIEFPFPASAERYRIWRRHFPDSAPVAPGIDFQFLADHFALAGGNIRNIVVNAAFLAAADGGVIGMPQVMQAMRREYEKIGRPCTEPEFMACDPVG